MFLCSVNRKPCGLLLIAAVLLGVLYAYYLSEQYRSGVLVDRGEERSDIMSLTSLHGEDKKEASHSLTSLHGEDKKEASHSLTSLHGEDKKEASHSSEEPVVTSREHYLIAPDHSEEPVVTSREHYLIAPDHSEEPVVTSREHYLIAPDHLQYKQPSILVGRTDVVTVTPWLAPVVWEQTFNPLLLDSIYKPLNITIATTVFAVGKYIRFLRDYLETAEQHFFVGFRVHHYVLTDRPNEVPKVNMAAGRQLTVRAVPSSKRWQEISARRMELIQTLIETDLRYHADYIFCLDVDSKFHGHWGTESLGRLVAVIHPGYYTNTRNVFPYERRPISRAYVAPGEGDFYYCGGAFGGLLQDVHSLAKTCRLNFEADAKDGVEAAWQEESHLNRYMWINKPSKVLSPEYLWQDFKPRTPEIRIIRFSGVIKNYAEIRPNV